MKEEFVPVDGYTAWKDEVERKRRENPLHVFAFLLYSRANEHLFNFVHQYYFELDRLTGLDFTVFVIWYTLLRDSEDGPEVMAQLSENFDPYQLATEFGIKKRKIPCFVFFRHIDGTDALVYSLNDDWKRKDLLEEFERLTDDVEKARDKAKGKREPEKSLWKNLHRSIKRREYVKNAVEMVTAAKPILDVVKTLLSFIK